MSSGGGLFRSPEAHMRNRTQSYPPTHYPETDWLSDYPRPKK